MPYDFDKIIERRGTDSVKWAGYGEDVLPMWVADMDFASPEPVIRALQERVEHGVFGYSFPPRELKEVIVAWLKERHGWAVTQDAIVFTPGVVTSFTLAARAFVAAGEGLVTQTPVYPPILHAAETSGVHSQSMELTRGADGRYTIDFDRFDATLTERSRMFLLCNPHNPVGRVFTPDELEHMAERCLARDMVICSDEIHGDLLLDGHRHRPIAALAPEIAARTITLMAPSKTFNIAGLYCSFAVIPDAKLRQRFKAATAGLFHGANVLGYVAALAAYRDGQPWLDAMLAYLETNRDVAARFVRERLPGVTMSPIEGTYLAWLDCRQAALIGNPHTVFLKRGRVALNDGAHFGPGGEGFARLNFGCPRALLLEGLERMALALTI